MQSVTNSIRRPIRDPLSGALFWMLIAAVAFPVRFELAVGPFTTLSALDVVLLVCLACLCTRILSLAPVQLGPPMVGLAVLVPAVVAACSIAWALDAALAAASAIKYLYAALIYFVALQLGAQQTQAQLAGALLAILLGWLAASLAMYLGVPGFGFFLPRGLGWTEREVFDLFSSVYTRLGHPYIGQSNDYGPLLALLGFIFLGFARLEKSRLAAAASGVAFTASLLTFSRGLALGLFISFGVYAILARLPLRRFAFPAMALAAALVLLGPVAIGLTIALDDREIALADILASRLSDANVAARLAGYRDTLALVVERAWLGHGAGYYDRSSPGALVSAHNAVLEQWKYFGIVLGTVTSGCYVGVMAYFFGLRRQRNEASVLTDAIACAWLCLVVASMVETFFEATTPRAVIYFVLGLCALMSKEAAGQARHR